MINPGLTDTLSGPVPLPTGAATSEKQDTQTAVLEKLVGFDVNADIATSIVTVGAVKTITETDGVKTNTTTVDKTDPLDINITNIWS